MEKMTDLEELFKDFKIPEVTYVAVFNPKTGEVTSVGPAYAFKSTQYKIDIDSETAESIIEGKIKINNCFVDTTGNTLEIAEVKSLFKIDDVLHRIIETEWSDIDKPDIYLTYSNKALTFQLSEEYGGTYKLAEEFQPVKLKKVIWSGDTELTFLISDYNDPNVLFKMLKFQLSELTGKPKTFKNIELPSNKFSVYTRRLFKNYVIEIK
jgi:hypothetical protein